MSLTARLTIRIFDAVCNFRTRQTVSITTRFPTIVKIHINGQIRIIIIKRAVFRVISWWFCERFVLLLNKSYVVADNNGRIVDCSRCRDELNIVVVIPFVSIIEDEIWCWLTRCCWTADTDENKEKIDKNEINIDVRLE
jgi:hypothetical protein